MSQARQGPLNLGVSPPAVLFSQPDDHFLELGCGRGLARTPGGARIVLPGNQISIPLEQRPPAPTTTRSLLMPHSSLMPGCRSLPILPMRSLETASVDAPAEHRRNDVHRPPPCPVHLERNAAQPAIAENTRGPRSRAGLKLAIVSGATSEINSVTVSPIVAAVRTCGRAFFRSSVAQKITSNKTAAATTSVPNAATADNRARQLGFEPGLAPSSTQAKPRSPIPVPRGREGSGLATPETETAEQGSGPDRFKTNSGVERPPFRFVTAFVTWRPTSSSWPERHGSEHRGIEPAFRFQSAFAQGSAIWPPM